MTIFLQLFSMMIALYSLNNRKTAAVVRGTDANLYRFMLNAVVVSMGVVSVLSLIAINKPDLSIYSGVCISVAISLMAFSTRNATLIKELQCMAKGDKTDLAPYLIGWAVSPVIILVLTLRDVAQVV